MCLSFGNTGPLLIHLSLSLSSTNIYFEFTLYVRRKPSETRPCPWDTSFHLFQPRMVSSISVLYPFISFSLLFCSLWSLLTHVPPSLPRAGFGPDPDRVAPLRGSCLRRDWDRRDSEPWVSSSLGVDLKEGDRERVGMWLTSRTVRFSTLHVTCQLSISQHSSLSYHPRSSSLVSYGSRGSHEDDKDE